MRKKKRLAKYRRVSKKEQAIRGFSLQAQDEALEKYAEENDYEIVGDYADEGITASTLNRPALQQLLADVRAGKIDMIIFTKLDRWFRSVAHYYKIQEILEEHGVTWRTVLEDYNTETSDGKFKVNIMLSVAQQELDRTSERIKVVFESKVKNKQAITGALPMGYTIGIVENEKRVIKNKRLEEVVYDFFAHFEIHQSLRATMIFINEKYGLHMSYSACKNTLRNRMYTGQYHDVEDYCPAYLTKERFNKIQKIFDDKKQVRVNRHVYLFSNLFRCKKCGGTMAGTTCQYRDSELYYYYRCSRAIRDAACDNKRRISEKHIEEYLLNTIEEKLKEYIVESEVKAAPKAKPRYNKSKIKAEIARLNNMYQKGRIDDAEYDEQYIKLQSKLDMCEVNHEERDLEPLKVFLKSDFKTIYNILTKEEKRATWRSIIDRMIFHDYDDIDIKFL